MAAESSQQEIQVSVGKDLATATIGGVKVEVSPDSNVVVYTNEGVRTKPAVPAGEATASADKDTQIRIIGTDFNRVALYGAVIAISADSSVTVYTNGTVKMKPALANDVVEKFPDLAAGRVEKSPDLAAGRLPQKVLEVGDRLRDGTVVIAVDLKNSKALFVPAAIFGGKATFDNQHEIPAKLNNDKTRNHGHDDWRNITDEEGTTLSEVWDKVAPDTLRGQAAPWFWLASSIYGDGRRVRRGGEADWDYFYRDSSLSVPCVRSGPAVVG